MASLGRNELINLIQCHGHFRNFRYQDNAVKWQNCILSLYQIKAVDGTKPFNMECKVRGGLVTIGWLLGGSRRYCLLIVCWRESMIDSYSFIFYRPNCWFSWTYLAPEKQWQPISDELSSDVLYVCVSRGWDFQHTQLWLRRRQGPSTWLGGGRTWPVLDIIRRVGESGFRDLPTSALWRPASSAILLLGQCKQKAKTELTHWGLEKMTNFG